MESEKLGGLTNEALDAYLDAEQECQTIAAPSEARDLFDELVGLGVPEKYARRAIIKGLPRELTDGMFGD